MEQMRAAGLLVTLFFSLAALSGETRADKLQLPFHFKEGDRASAAQVNANLDALLKAINALDARVKTLQQQLEAKQVGDIPRPTSGAETPDKVIDATNRTAPSAVKVAGFAFSATGCWREPLLLKCIVQVINEHADERPLKLYRNYSQRNSTMVDNEGNQYSPKKVEFGAFSEDYYMTQTLPSGVRINITMWFENVSETMTSASVRIDGDDMVDNVRVSATLKGIGVL